MAEKKKIFVIIFALILSIVPQGIYWYEPENYFEIGIPYCLFRSRADRVIEIGDSTYTFDSGELVKGQMWHMKFMAYAYMLVMLVLLIEFICQLVKKKKLETVIQCTVNIAVIVSTIQFVTSLFYFRKYWPIANSWTWMNGICFIQMMITRAFRTSIHGYEYSERESRTNILRNLLYIWLLGISTYGNCFRHIFSEYTEEEIDWRGYNAFFMEGWNWFEGVSIPRIYIIFTILLVVIAIILTTVKEEIIERLVVKMDKILEWLTIILMVWIVGVCLVSPQMKEPTWYFMPGICYSILLSWGCWRLTGVGEKQID